MVNQSIKLLSEVIWKVEKVLNELMDLSNEISTWNVERISWLLLSKYEKDELIKENNCLSTECVGNIKVPELAELKDKTISHLQSQDSQCIIWNHKRP